MDTSAMIQRKEEKRRNKQRRYCFQNNIFTAVNKTTKKTESAEKHFSPAYLSTVIDVGEAISMKNEKGKNLS